MRTRARFTLMLCCSFLLAFQIGSARAVDPVKIVCLGEFTGKYANDGMALLHSTRFNVEEKNKAGGIKSLGGAKIELVEADCQSDPKIAVAETERLASDPKVLAFLGPSLSAIAPAVEPVHGKYGVPAIYSLATSDDIFEHGNPWVFSCGALASGIGADLAKGLVWLNEKYKVPINRIGFIYIENDYGITVAQNFRKEMKRRNLEKNIAVEVRFDGASKDMTPVVMKLKAADPDIVVMVCYFATGKLFHDACFTLDFHPWMVGGVSGFTHPNLWQALGQKIAEATLGNPKTLAYDAVTPLDTPNKTRDEWLKRFKSRNPDAPVDFSVLMGAQASLLMIDAIEKGGRSRAGVRDALHNMKAEKNDPRIVVPNWELPGPVFGPGGKPNSHMVFVQWEKAGDKWKVVYLWHPTDGPTGTVPRAFRK